MKYIFGNWKANKTLAETNKWAEDFSKHYIYSPSIAVGIFPPSPYILTLATLLKQHTNVSIGAQSVSPFERGSYTGETTASHLKGHVSYSIVGHSERRKWHKETNEELLLQTKHLLTNAIHPVYCVRDENDPIPQSVKIIAYEPVHAIGTGQNENPIDVIKMKKKLQIPTGSVFLYGGSVNETNAKNYLETGEIDGFLVGKASLDAFQFNLIIQAAR